MSILHVNQIKSYLENEYFQFVELTSEESQSDHAVKYKFTRSLAAIGLNILTDCGQNEACQSVVDGPDDNGIDAICYGSDERCLYIAQSKFHHDGNGTIDLGDTLKYLQGVKDIMNARFERFNSKVQSQKSTIE